MEKYQANMYIYEDKLEQKHIHYGGTKVQRIIGANSGLN